MTRRNKEQPYKKQEKASSLFPAIALLLAAAIGPIIAYQCGLNAQLKISEKQNRQKAYADLMGQKAMLRQLYVSRVESTILCDYYQALWRLTGFPKESLFHQESINNLRKSERLAIEVAKITQKIFETIGLIRTSFPNSPKLNELTEKIYRFYPPKILGDASKMDLNELKGWKNKSVKNLQDFVEREYSGPIDELLVYMANEIAKDGE
jgi:hypothetical protein